MLLDWKGSIHIAKDGGSMIKVTVPATSANLGPGFDTLGMALNIFLTVKVAATSEKGYTEFIGEGKEELSNNIDNNLILMAAKKIFDYVHLEMPELIVQVENQIPLGKGLGSSAAAIVAGILIANEMLNKSIDQEQLINLAVEMEGHADNIVPAMVGGLTTVMLNQGNVIFHKFDVPQELELVVAVPDFSLPTKQARSVLPASVSQERLIMSLQQTSYLLAGLVKKEFKHLNLAMNDMIFQPLRKQFIPGFDKVIEDAQSAGALGVALSGAGPSVIALTHGKSYEVGVAMQQAFAANGVECKILTSRPCNYGAYVERSTQDK